MTEMKPYEIISTAIEQYQPNYVFGLFSGGHDSLCACHIASKHPSFNGCVHINTGIGIEETRDFVRATCETQGWPLIEVGPDETYENLVVDQGFPGPGHHWKMYQRLKERALRKILREFRDPDNRSRKIVFVSGRRRRESKRRMRTTTEAITTGLKNPSPRIVWVNPIIDWDGGDKNRYIDENDLDTNPVVEKLCMSGECLCGAFASPGELNEIRMFYPDAAEEIDRIAALAREAGVPSRWGERPTPQAPPNQIEMPLCWSCEAIP